MRKKDPAFIQKVLPVLLSVGMMFGFILFSAQLMEIFRARERISQTARAYLLEMETVGYLTASDQERILTQLKQCGLKEVSLLGTTATPAEFGEQICLAVSGNLEITAELAIPFLGKTSKAWSVPIEFSYVSTAKH